jgi:hypothetical protein
MTDIEVEIEDLECDRVAWCKTRFTVELNIDVSGGSMPIMVDKKFVVEKEYNGSRASALMLCPIAPDDARLTAELNRILSNNTRISTNFYHICWQRCPYTRNSSPTTFNLTTS